MLSGNIVGKKPIAFKDIKITALKILVGSYTFKVLYNI
jgi:hypothetical protein